MNTWASRIPLATGTDATSAPPTAMSPATTSAPLTPPPASGIHTRTFTPKTIEVKPHPNRPHNIPGHLRFETWVPHRPPGVKPQSAAVRKVLVASFALGTKKNYSTALAQWHNFCDRHSVAEEDRGPAKVELVELWVASEAGDKSGGYLKDWLAALRAWHTLNNIAWRVNDDRIVLLRRGVKVVQPPPKPKRPAMTVQWLHAILHTANLGDPQELAVVTVATCGLWGLFRLGELVLTSVKDFNPRHHVTRAHLKNELVPVGDTPALVVTVNLPRTKTQADGEPVTLTPQEHPGDPVGMLHLFLQRNPVPNPADTPLFSYWQGGTLHILTREAHLRVLDKLARRAKLESVAGHSMRIGGCTTLLLRGVPPDRVMMHGRWGSDSFKRYIREHASILAPFLANSIGVRQQLIQMDSSLADVLGGNTPQRQERANAAHSTGAHDARDATSQAPRPASTAVGSASALGRPAASDGN
ncbi:hypothetical protein CF326_g5605 [Tilletia indica]|nr:hypothetical protein CF326_g5605 [Tilletia indica]